MKRSLYDWILEVATLLALAWNFYPLCYYRKMTDILPLHYSALGESAVWGKLSFFWMFPLFSLLLYVGIAVLQRHYKKLNYPVEITEGNAQSLYRLALGMLRHTKLITIALFGYINSSSFSATIDRGRGVNIYIVTLLSVGLVIIIFYYIVRMIRLEYR